MAPLMGNPQSATMMVGRDLRRLSNRVAASDSLYNRFSSQDSCLGSCMYAFELQVPLNSCKRILLILRVTGTTFTNTLIEPENPEQFLWSVL